METTIVDAKMSKEKIARIIKTFSLALIVIAMVSFAVSMFTVTETLTESLFTEETEEPIQVSVMGDPISGTLTGIASLRIVGGGVMSTNVSATLEIMDAQGNTLFSGSNSTTVSPGEIKYLTMRFSISDIDLEALETLNASLRLGFRTFFNLIGMEFSTGLRSEGD